jgi:hypothetical protein
VLECLKFKDIKSADTYFDLISSARYLN